MERPVEVELPHKLGREEARRRIEGNVHKLTEHIPGGASHVKSGWSGDNLSLQLQAMGQTVDADIAVEETKLRLRVVLPGMLAMFARPFEAMLNAKGAELLLENKNKKG